ncbi:hypothetical protein M514_01361, partial [Trichuris suis]
MCCASYLPHLIEPPLAKPQKLQQLPLLVAMAPLTGTTVPQSASVPETGLLCFQRACSKMVWKVNNRQRGVTIQSTLDKLSWKPNGDKCHLQFA